MKFYSHAQTTENGEKYGSKLLHVHTKGVLNNAIKQLHSRINFSIPFKELKQILEYISTFHDLGKYTHYFQHYLLDHPTEKDKKQHARFGAITLYNLYQNLGVDQKLAYLAYYIILYHHRNLTYPLDTQVDKLLDKHYSDDDREIFEAQTISIQQYLSVIEQEISINKLDQFLYIPEIKRIKKFLRNWLEKTSASVGIEDYFLINYLFSLLIEADKLDASDTPIHFQQQLPSKAVDYFIQSLQINPSHQNNLRNEVRNEVIKQLAQPEILTTRIFLLTAPTGIGKTLTALDFALQLRVKIQKAENFIPQIITALPFINIIEQTLSVYQAVLPEAHAKILGHYQYADVFGSQEKSDDQGYDQKLMQLDTWQSDIIVTSFVQLLQTLISNKNKLLKKFNHLAGAIIIMDEVQSMRLEQVPLIGAMLYFLSEYLNTRLLLMTATQPLIFELAETHILEKYGVTISNKIIQLLDHPLKYFQEFHRTKLIPIIHPKLESEKAFINLFLEKWDGEKSCLIVVNTVNRSLKVFQAIRDYFEIEAYNNPVYYLSTNIIPAHRLERIQRIKNDLKSGKCPILISTQVVEAGVDLDFDMGFRDLGPIDSIVQVAGRINRENNDSRKYSPLYIVNFGDCTKIYGPITNHQAKSALSREIIYEPEYYDLVAIYFNNLSEDSVYKYAENMFEAISSLKYDGEDEYVISKFCVIEEAQNTLSIFVDYNQNASFARQAFVNMFSSKGKEKFQYKKLFDQQHKRMFHQHIITIPKYYVPSTLEKIVPEATDLDIYVVPLNNVNQYYDFQTGFIRESQDHSLDYSTVIL